MTDNDSNIKRGVNLASLEAVDATSLMPDIDLEALTGSSDLSKIIADNSMRELQDRMKSLTELSEVGSASAKLAEQIAEQSRMIETLQPKFPDSLLHNETIGHTFPIEPMQLPEIPPNPIIETNRRLRQIENRFDQMHSVATNAAGIATGLQAHAAEFLQKFEKAAHENDRSAGRAIWLGAIAVLIALIMPAAQIAYTEFWRVPADSADMQSVIAEMRSEISSLKEAQVLAAERLAKEIETSNNETATALREIGSILTGTVNSSDQEE